MRNTITFSRSVGSAIAQCDSSPLTFQPLGTREVVAAFDGGKVTSDAGGLLLREIEQRFHFVEQFARCFTDHRDPDRIEHTVLELYHQLLQVMGLEAIYPKHRTSLRSPGHRKYPYLLRGLQVDRPNQVWTSDITYVPLARGFMHLVAIID